MCKSCRESGNFGFVRAAGFWFNDAIMSFYEKLKFDAQGLIPAIIQEAKTGRVVMMAWMNRASLEDTIKRHIRKYPGAVEKSGLCRYI